MKRALISVFDKTNIVEFARELDQLGWEIISTGGTSAKFKAEGIPVMDISDLTQFPECFCLKTPQRNKACVFFNKYLKHETPYQQTRQQ